MGSTVGADATYHLNRLAGTLLNDIPQYDFDGAAIIWATNVLAAKHTQTKGVGALNLIYAFRNGGKNYNYDIPGVLNALAGTWGLGENLATSLIVS